MPADAVKMGPTGGRALVELVGREREVAAVVDRLGARRLVTVLGPGGIGKTALAGVAAAAFAPQQGAEVRFVDLTRVTSPEDLADAVAAQLGFPSFDALVDTPIDRALLVVDNCEHVIDAAADVVAELVGTSGSLRVLATSRSPLDLPGESIVLLGPLGLPPPGIADPGADAVRLFLERAADAGRPDDADDLDAVCELCRRLDGVPLAVELAAARTRTLTPAEILTHFDRQLDVVARPRHRGTTRHRSLRAAIEWSYRMLEPDERAVFDRLSVFDGPFTLDHAHAVAGDGADDRAATLDVLDGLVASSLVIAEPGAALTRYRLLDSLRAFAAEQLHEAGEWDATADRLAAHAVELAADVAANPDGAWGPEALAAMVGSFDTLAAAARWCVLHDDDPGRAMLLVAVMWAIVHQARTAEIAEVGERVLTRWSDPSVGLWPDAAATVATAYHLLGRRHEAAELARRGLEATGRSVLAPVTLRRALALARRAGGELVAAREPLVDAASHARALGATGMAIELEALAAESLVDGDPAAALDELRRCQAEAEHSGAELLSIWTRAVQGHVLLRTDPRAAGPVVDDALGDARRAGYHSGTGAALSAAAQQRLLTERPDEAARITLELLHHLVTTGAVGMVRTALELAAVVLRRLGRAGWTDLAATSSSLPSRGGLPRELTPALRPPVGDGRVLRVRDAMALALAELRRAGDGAEVGPRGLVGRHDPVPGDERGDGAPPVTTFAGDAAAAGADGAVFRPRGEMWELVFAGHSALVRATKGMDDLVRLLAAPGRELHCLDLAGAAVAEPDTGAVIDDAARRAYEERVRELQSDIDEAEANRDLARAERAQVEMDSLVDQLTAALGMGRRARRAGASSERARSTVTQRIRSTIRRIADVHPALGRHLAASVRTGAYCSYQPEHPIDWRTS